MFKRVATSGLAVLLLVLTIGLGGGGVMFTHCLHSGHVSPGYVGTACATGSTASTKCCIHSQCMEYGTARLTSFTASEMQKAPHAQITFLPQPLVVEPSAIVTAARLMPILTEQPAMAPPPDAPQLCVLII